MKCIHGYEVKPMASAAGYFMGTTDEGGFPNCRITYGYAKTKEEAKELPLDRQNAMENCLCNGGCGCFCTAEKDYDGLDKDELFALLDMFNLK